MKFKIIQIQSNIISFNEQVFKNKASNQIPTLKVKERLMMSALFSRKIEKEKKGPSRVLEMSYGTVKLLVFHKDLFTYPSNHGILKSFFHKAISVKIKHMNIVYLIWNFG